VQGDVSDGASVAACFARAREELGPIDILVNNAAVTSNVGLVRELPLSKWDQDLAVNLTGAFYCVREGLADMEASGWGRVINVSSGAAELGSFGQAGYAASKAGLLGLTRSVALESARAGITCNAVLPGLIDAPAAAGIRPDMRERIVKLIPVRRMGQPEEVAYAVSWLASARASYVNGATLFVSAGQELFSF
jgi:3-oxoacyl-[acyl-carrier protein] reductase